jgi:hypothetical protein
MQYDLSELMRLAQSPAGQQLIALLQQNGGARLQTAVEKAGSGDFTQAKQILSSLLSNPEAQVLLKQLEDGQ